MTSGPLETVRLAGAGVQLAADAMGPEEGTPVLFLHGGGQTRQSWGAALPRLAAQGYRAITVDLRGHGDSDWSRAGDYTLRHYAEDLHAVLDGIGRPTIVVGASLGGLAAMLAGAADPARIRAMILVDIAAKLNAEGLTEISAFMNAHKDGFASIEDAAEAVAAYLPYRRRRSSTGGLARNLRLRDGRYYWHWDPLLMSPEAQAGSGADELGEAASTLRMPVLLVRGGRSRVVNDEGVRDLLEKVPHADYVRIDEADHMVAGDANDAFLDAILAFIERQTP